MDTTNVIDLPALKERRSSESIEGHVAELAAQMGCSLDVARERLETAADILVQRPDMQAEIDRESESALDVLIAFSTQCFDNHQKGTNIETSNEAAIDLAIRRIAYQGLAHGLPSHKAEAYAEMVVKFIAECIGMGGSADEIKEFIRAKEPMVWREQGKHHPKPRTPNKSGRRTKKR